MTPEQEQLAYLRGAIEQWPPVHRGAINAAAAKIRDVVKEYGDAGPVALALVGAEMAVDAP